MSLGRWMVMGRKDYNEALITVVRLQGILQASLGPARGPQARRLINIDRVEKWFARAFYKGIKPAACAIAINSPGGSPTQSDLIHSLVRRLSKDTGIPVYTFAEDVAASGGYWLMCAGDKLYASETSLLGSIGVISATFGAVDAAARLGLERRVFTAGEAKMQLDPFLPVQPEQEARLRDLMEDLHDSFKGRVRASRGDRLQGSEQELFSGRAWTGRQALKLGLIDGIGDLRTVMREQYGDKARFLLCSDKPTSGLADLLGLSSWLPGSASTSGHLGVSHSSSSTCNTSGGESMLARVLGGAGGGEAAAYGAARCAAEAVVDEVEERAVWAPYRVQ
ncbi:hypothetical protein N2152v2_009654 [Parachlorella kessleri]